MGNINIKESDDTWLIDVSTKSIRNADVMRSGDYVFLKYTKGKFRINEFSVCRLYKTEQWAFPLSLSTWPWQKDFIDILVRLKLMSKERRSELLEIDGQRRIEQQRKYDVEELERIRKRYNADKQIDSLIKAIA